MRRNSFDDVRLIAALTVLVAHSPLAYGGAIDIRLGGFFAGSLAVHVFFAISGYLIAQSWFTDPDLTRFLARRALRLVPALLVVVLAAMFVIGPVFTTLDLGAYFASAEMWSYLGNAALMLQYKLPGVFESQPEPQLGVNPPLWSLAYEALCYIGLVGAAVVCKRCPPLVAPLLMAGVVVLSSSAMMLPQHAHFACLCFALGVALYRYRDSIVWHPGVGFLVFAVFTVLAPQSPEQQFATLAAVSYTAVAVGRSTWRPLRLVTRHGDISYGTYIWAYPVQRVVNELLGFDSHWLVSLGLCLVATLPIAWLSWRIVERPALAFKPQGMKKDPMNDAKAGTVPS